MTEQKCQTCRFARSDGHSRGTYVCRRSAPVLPEGKDFGRWPLVQADDWCGEYAPSTVAESG